jgi:hypothetical protein
MLPEDQGYGLCQACEERCPVCRKPGTYWQEHYDRYGCYSGRACEQCAHTLPGQGRMWNYEPEHNEPIDEEP